MGLGLPDAMPGAPEQAPEIEPPVVPPAPAAGELLTGITGPDPFAAASQAPDENQIALAAIGGARGMAQALAATEAQHPAYMLHASAGPRMGAPATERLLADGDGEAAESEIPDADIVFDTDSPLVAISPDEVDGATQIARRLGAPGAVGWVDAIAAKLRELPNHARAAQRRPEGGQAQALGVAAFEMARFDAAVDKGILRGELGKQATAAWKRLRSGGTAPEDLVVLTEAMMTAAEALQWNTSGDLSITGNPAAEMTGLDLTTGEVEFRLLDLPPTSDPDEKYRRTVALANRNPRAVAALVGDDLVERFERGIPHDEFRAWAKDPTTAEVPGHLAGAFKRAVALIGDVPQLDRRLTPGELAALVGTDPGAELDEIAAGKMRLTFTGPNAIDDTPEDMLPASPRDLAPQAPPSPEIALSVKGGQTIAGTRGEAPRGRWATSFAGPDGTRLLAPVAEARISDAETEMARLADAAGPDGDTGVVVYAGGAPSAWLDEGEHLVVMADDATARRVASAMKRLGADGKTGGRARTLAKRGGANSIAKVNVSTFSFTNPDDLAPAVQAALAEGASVRAYTEGDSVEGLEAMTEAYEADAVGTVLTRLTEDAPGPTSVRVFVDRRPDNAPAALDRSIRQTSPTEAVYGRRAQITGNVPIRPGKGRPLLDIETFDGENWSQAQEAIITIGPDNSVIVSYDGVPLDPARSFRYRPGHLEGLTDEEGKYLGGATIDRVRHWIASVGESKPVKLGEWT